MKMVIALFLGVGKWGGVFRRGGRCYIKWGKSKLVNEAGVVGDATGPRPEELGPLAGQ